MEIEWIPSAFFDTKKRANKMIIIHHTGSTNGKINSFDGTIRWFKPEPPRTDKKVSAEYIIAREERPIVQMVKDEHRAYHAGRSEWRINGKLVKWLNNWSIGIELQGDGNLFEYTDFQYEAVIWLCREKMKKFDIPVDLVQGHEHISPGRKVDPGALFDWKRVRQELHPKIQVPVTDTPKPEPPAKPAEPVPENEDVELPDGGNSSVWMSILDFFFSLFGKK